MAPNVTGNYEASCQTSRKRPVPQSKGADRQAICPDGAASKPNSRLPRRQLTKWSESRALELSGKAESTPANYCKLWRLRCVEPVSVFTVLFWEKKLLKTQNFRASNDVHTALHKENVFYLPIYSNILTHNQTIKNLTWLDIMWPTSSSRTCKPVYRKNQQR